MFSLGACCTARHRPEAPGSRLCPSPTAMRGPVQALVDPAEEDSPVPTMHGGPRAQDEDLTIARGTHPFHLVPVQVVDAGQHRALSHELAKAKARLDDPEAVAARQHQALLADQPGRG